MKRRGYSTGSLILFFILILLASLTGCATYVERLNADCRVLKDFTIVDTNACVVCAKDGKFVAACEITNP